ncbi:conserved hypothetical protein [uncultured Desulfobacterium sp.]|uniref:Spermatogenesis-associated protein 20-like TRX domain-containing protein n=1 Tax=uncultured Desulfobacterium sp. TaxID=201089 RepID=A0A445N2Q0_9BACT|nr:conserved hypothetical protein [uncultured Desulfobacterium sp.]
MHSFGIKKEKSLNRLAFEKSPYLLQHSENPVDWRPWGAEAFSKAKTENKPVFLSIGYATCHWCHVMAHESFEDDEVALILNKNFVAIKVDREERPDIDILYMSVCQAMTGRGGWPLSVFMTPEAKPFYAGTYFPKTGRLGLSGFVDVLRQIISLWENDRGRLLDASDKIINYINMAKDSEKSVFPVGIDILKECSRLLKESYDPLNGGFGSAPKFPTPHQLTFLMRWYKRSRDQDCMNMVERTFDAMRSGGIFDQIGFGFHRYSVDEKWLVPHFEKMLYDQALLAMAYTEAFQLTGKKRFGDTAKEIFTYVLRDMQSPDGGFYSAEDADSEGREGLFYVWTPNEIKAHLGAELGELVCRFYGISEEGNFEDGLSIAHLPLMPEEFAASEGVEILEFEKTLENVRSRLFEERNKRVHPLKDDKILTSWNGLMIAALARGCQVFDKKAYADAAAKASEFILKKMKEKDGRLLRRYRQQEAAFPGYLDDYAFFVWGLIELYEATLNGGWLREAIGLNEDMIDIFWDEKDSGFYFTGKGNEELITRIKEIYDGAIPSGNSVAALNLLRLGRMNGDAGLEKKAERLIQAFSGKLVSYPPGYTQMLTALDLMLFEGLKNEQA